jgi:hypothetical protein
MTEAKKLAFTVYATDPDGGGTVRLIEGTKASDIPQRIRDTLGAHVWQDDDSGVEPDAPAPPGGVTGQDAGSLDRNGDGEPDGPTVDVSGSVKTVLADVGDDQAKAQAALDAEQAGQNRTTLVSKLQAIVGGAGS